MKLRFTPQALSELNAILDYICCDAYPSLLSALAKPVVTVHKTAGRNASGELV